MKQSQPLRVYFNSHPHEEDDRNYSLQIFFSGYFNSHPHEEDDGITEN